MRTKLEMELAISDLFVGSLLARGNPAESGILLAMATTLCWGAGLASLPNIVLDAFPTVEEREKAALLFGERVADLDRRFARFAAEVEANETPTEAR